MYICLLLFHIPKLLLNDNTCADKSIQGNFRRIGGYYFIEQHEAVVHRNRLVDDKRAAGKGAIGLAIEIGRA